MRPSTIWYTLKQGIINIKRNWMFSIASVLTMAACIFLFGIFYSIMNNVDHIARKVEKEVPITVFFEKIYIITEINIYINMIINKTRPILTSGLRVNLITLFFLLNGF